MSQDRISLGPRLEGAARPTFIARAGVSGLRVELDSSAIFKLVPPTKVHLTEAILEQERPQITSAAQRLFEGGFYSTDPEIVITLTALDL